MRADRLVATLLLMQARGRVTAREVAAELEASVATVRRDFEALSAAGIPVYPQAGRGGGWQLIGGARTDLSGLSAAETRALFLLVGPAASVAPEAKSALRKLVRALPDTFRTDAEAAAEAVVIDPDRWGQHHRDQPALVATLQDAVVRRLKVRVTYRGWNRDSDETLCDPWGLVEKGGVWYVLGGVGGSPRTYRVDRIGSLTVTEEAAERPVDFDLAAAWNVVVGEVNEQRARAWATVEVSPEAPPEIVPYLRHHFGDSMVTEERVGAEVEGQRLVVRVSAPAESLIVRGLAGWGADLSVIGPASVRAQLAQLGEALVQRNAASRMGI